MLGAFPEVSEVCVYGIPAASGAPGESDLVAALAPFEGQTIDPKTMVAKCRRDLEPNFVPSFLQVVATIPKTISEKALDRVLREQFAPDAENVYRSDDF